MAALKSNFLGSAKIEPSNADKRGTQRTTMKIAVFIQMPKISETFRSSQL
jgi:hypothetical protein